VPTDRVTITARDETGLHLLGVRYLWQAMRCGSQAVVVGAILIATLGGCGDTSRDAENDDYRDPYMDEPLPPVCRDTSTGPCETDGESVDACAASSECADGLSCRADFDGERTAFACTDVCVPTANEDAWCIDDASCCDPAATCSPRGYCLLP